MSFAERSSIHCPFLGESWEAWLYLCSGCLYFCRWQCPRRKTV